MLQITETKKKTNPMAGYCQCGSIIPRDASLHLHSIASELTPEPHSRGSSSHQGTTPSSGGRAPCGLHYWLYCCQALEFHCLLCCPA